MRRGGETMRFDRESMQSHDRREFFRGDARSIRGSGARIRRRTVQIWHEGKENRRGDAHFRRNSRHFRGETELNRRSSQFPCK